MPGSANEGKDGTPAKGSEGKDGTPAKGSEGNHCVACQKPDSWNNMVQCDTCNSWWHQSCAGVTGSISERPWSCRNCIPAISESSVLTTPSIRNRRKALQLQLLEEKRALDRRAREIHEEQLNSKLEEIRAEKKYVAEKFKLLQEEDISAIEEEVHSVVSHRSRQQRVQSWIADTATTNGAVALLGGHAPGKNQQQQLSSAIQHELMEDIQLGQFTPKRNTGAYPKRSVVQKTIPDSHLCTSEMDISPVQPKTTKTALELRQATVDSTQPLAMSSVMPPGYDQVPGVYGKQQPPPLSKTVHQTAGKTVPFTSFIDQSKLPEQESESLSHLIEQLGLSPQEKDNFAHVWTAYQPTPSQIAARQVMHRDLPVFTGVLAEWPVFISTYTDTTLACGYSPAENLLRLQRCLKGPALEAVRSKLTMPKCVPQIMETLRLFYGRPELIINALLEKIRATPAPKSERLEALIDYGIAVNSICDNLEAANLHDHLSNPSLLSELVNRLPAHIKYQWGAHIAMLNDVNLKTFSVFMKGVVQSVSRVCVYSGAVMNEENSKAKRGVVHTHAELSKETNVPAKKGCPSCSGEHYLKYCEKFKSLEIDDRWHFIQSMGICRTCLFAHGKRSCRSNNRCGVSGCTSRHHPLLHSNRSSPPSGVQSRRTRILDVFGICHWVW